MTDEYAAPLKANIPAGYELFDELNADDIAEALEHNCGCRYCTHGGEAEGTLSDLGEKVCICKILVIQTGEAFGEKVEWHRLTEKDIEHTDYEWTGSGWKNVGIPYDFYLGHGCWTRYNPKESGAGQEPYGEHVCRILAKIEDE